MLKSPKIVKILCAQYDITLQVFSDQPLNIHNDVIVQPFCLINNLTITSLSKFTAGEFLSNKNLINHYSL